MVCLLTNNKYGKEEKIMSTHLAYCGINCASCKLYQATLSKNDVLRDKVAKEWSIMYKREFDLDSFFCYGCKSDLLFELCLGCDIKACNQEKGSSSCRACIDYPCERIKQFEKYQADHKTGVY
jgi:hypothetical protein